MKKVFICLTSAGTWGKSEQLFESIINAKAQNRIESELVLAMIETDKPEKVGVDDMGSIHYNHDDKVTYLTEPKKCPKLSILFTLENSLGFALEQMEEIDIQNNYKYNSLIQKVEDFKDEHS